MLAVWRGRKGEGVVVSSVDDWRREEGKDGVVGNMSEKRKTEKNKKHIISFLFSFLFLLSPSPSL